MSETNMRYIQRVVGQDLVALQLIISDLAEIEEQLQEETLFLHFPNDIKDVHHTVRLAYRRLGELYDEYALHADAREPAGPDALGGVKVIDQPVSPATSPQENP